MCPPKLQELLAQFSDCTNARERLARLLALGKELPPLDEQHQRQETLVPGCQSVVYIVGEAETTVDEEGTESLRVQYKGTSDALLVKGMVALLIEGLNDATPEEILAVTPEDLRSSGLGQSLVPSRTNGLFHILKRMQDEAKRLQEVGRCATTSAGEAPSR